MPKQQLPGMPELTGNDRYEGYCADLIDKVANYYSFKYEIKPVKDQKYGSQDKDGNWNGMVGELIRHVSSSIV